LPIGSQNLLFTPLTVVTLTPGAYVLHDASF
jgi:hypothetical protein